jgi:hypothetical protein
MSALITGGAGEVPWVPANLAPRIFGRGWSRREVYRWMESDALRWRLGSDGKREMNPVLLPVEQQLRWRDWRLANADRPAVVTPHVSQANLWPRDEIDAKIAVLGLSESERDCVIRRFRIVDLCLNSNWRVEGYGTKKKFKKALGKRHGISVATIERWVRAWLSNHDLLDLRDDSPGPRKKGYGTSLDEDVKAQIVDCHTFKRFKKAQTVRWVHDYLAQKQASPGCAVAHFYHIPSRATIERYFDSLGAIQRAIRAGGDEPKAICGQVDRTYCSLRALDRVEIDEKKFDLFSYMLARPKKENRFWLLTAFDEGAMYPLVWRLVEGDKFDKRHGITQEDEIALFVDLVRTYGVPGAIVSDRGRFRGGVWGAGDRFKDADGIFDRFGVKHLLSRVKNPRRARLERFHRFLADCERTLPGAVGANERERKMMPGDAQAALHRRWAAGDPAVPKTPLLSTEELLFKVNEFMEQWRDHPSEGNGMCGLSPRAVFAHKTPHGGFVRVSAAELELKTAQSFPETLILKGGIIELRDGVRYSDPLLIDLAGQRREVTRSRVDHSRICVLRAGRDGENIFARRRERVDVNDPDLLTREMEYQARLRKIFGESLRPLDWNLEAGSDPEQEDEPKVICAKEVIIAREPSGEGDALDVSASDDPPKQRVVPLDFPELVS